ncbi:GNAT family N-acetyltransferase [Streptomyces sp. BBFR102]|uniref:GNAT family N-acetyltransferase n=1 Tax=Streptomyces sp. BBFR102 TaxID=3448171 RepID=UPI003F52C5E4
MSDPAVPATAPGAPQAARPEPTGPVPYTCEVPGTGPVSFRPLAPERDAALVHTWVDDERARFWGMVGHTVERVREVYAFLDGLDTHHAYLMEHAGRPVGLLQTYQPQHDPLGDYYPVRPGDVGIHLLFAPAEGAPRPGFGGALLTAILDFVWADPAHLRVVGEPDARNTRCHRRLSLGGFTAGEEIAMEHKSARLFFLERRSVAAPTGRTDLG